MTARAFDSKLVKSWPVSAGNRTSWKSGLYNICLRCFSVKSRQNFNHTTITLLKDMKANNYEVVDAGETIKFRGIVQRSASQAFFLVFCTALAFLSLGLVLQIQFNDLGKKITHSPGNGSFQVPFLHSQFSSLVWILKLL